MGKTLIYIDLLLNVHLACLFIDQVDNEEKISDFLPSSPIVKTRCHHLSNDIKTLAIETLGKK
jgi:hypothetical protein